MYIYICGAHNCLPRKNLVTVKFRIFMNTVLTYKYVLKSMCL